MVPPNSWVLSILGDTTVFPTKKGEKKEPKKNVRQGDPQPGTGWWVKKRNRYKIQRWIQTQYGHLVAE